MLSTESALSSESASLNGVGLKLLRLCVNLVDTTRGQPAALALRVTDSGSDAEVCNAFDKLACGILPT